MKNFPSLLAVIGAWLCAFGLIQFGIVAFIFSSIWAMFINEDFGWFTLAFFTANVVSFIRLMP